MKVTAHAGERIRERLGIPKSGADKAARRALEKGLERKDTAGKLRRYLDHVFAKYGTADNMRLYGQKVFIFAGETLITVLSLPTCLFEVARKAMDKRKKVLATT